MGIHREEASLDASLLESIFEIFWKMEISRGRSVVREQR
jgi:hypothetical protein